VPTLQLEESRRRPPSASTHVEADPGESAAGESQKIEKNPETHQYEPGNEDDQGRTVCVCGELWEHKSHFHGEQAQRLPAEQRWVYGIRAELDDYMVLLKKLRAMPPDVVFMELSAITARLAEIRLTCVRSESRRLSALRTREIDPLLDECDRQFRFHSRIQSVRQAEWEQTRNLT
jgi:hypothetical protein